MGDVVHTPRMSFPIKRKAIVSICWHICDLGVEPVVWLWSGSSI